MIILFRLIDEEQNESVNFGGDFGWKKYNDLDTIYGWLDDLVKKYPDIITNYNYGKSYEGRPLRAVKVSHKKVCNEFTAISLNFEHTNNIEFTGKSNHFH